MVPLAAVRPSRVDSVLVGRMAIRLPPPLTQVVNVGRLCRRQRDVPEHHHVVGGEGAAETEPMSMVANSLMPSVRRISAR